MRSDEYALVGPFHVQTFAIGRGQFPGSMLRWASGFDTRIELCFQVVLIRGRGRTILVNTGFDRDLSDVNRDFSAALGTTIERRAGEWIHDILHKVGITAADVTDLVLTPLGTYSCARVQDFDRADIWVAEAGWISFHTWHDHPHDARNTTFSPESLAFLTGPGWPRLKLVKDVAEVVPGVRLRWVGGHHRATMTVEVETAGPTIAVSDVYFHQANLDENHPIGMSENIYEVLAEYARVRDGRRLAVPMMDPQNFARFPDGVVCRSAD
jgi:glyoxylase-like metal-dependent hydrolase (beta-lactamase superfamily II)